MFFASSSSHEIPRSFLVKLVVASLPRVERLAASVEGKDARANRRFHTQCLVLVLDERDNHAVEVEEEHDQMEAELDERFLAEIPESAHHNPTYCLLDFIRTFLCTFSFLKISVASSKC